MEVNTMIGILSVFTLCSIGVDAALPTGDALLALAHTGFLGLDGNHDGLMTLTEWNMFESAADKDGDGCMTLQEYLMITSNPSDVATAIFKAVDKTHTGCITKLQLDSEFAMMDTNVNGEVTEEEFKAFYRRLFAQIEAMAQVG